MAPAPGPGHPDGDGEIQTPTSIPTAAMSSSQAPQENGPSTTTLSLPSSYPYYSSSWIGSFPSELRPIATFTDFHSMVITLGLDSDGNPYRVSSPYNKEGGAPTSTYSTLTTPLAELSPTPSHFTASPVTNSAEVTSSASSGPASGFQQPEHHGPPMPVIIAMSITIPDIVIVLSLYAFYLLCVRRKRRIHQDQEVPAMAAARRVPEMKDTGVGGAPVMLSARAVAPVSTGSGTTSLTSPATTFSAGTGTPPVILSTMMNDAYYTGIDTSDHISLTDQRSEASADTFGEEPPPPYRPRSVPPISRETSVRNSMCRNASVRSSRHDPMSGSNMMRRSVDVRSPFDDPEDSDDDNFSQVSTIRSSPRRDTDRLSVVSDMSYQEESVHAHSGT